MRDLPPRHQTRAATIAWSYDLLAPDAQDLLRRLSVFAGGFTREAIQAVASSSTPDSLVVEAILAALVDQSLVRRTDSDADLRFTMLETIREYAASQLAASADKTSARNAHAAYFLALVEEANPHLASTADPGWLDRLEAEHDNLLAALAWLAESGDVARTVRLAGALGWFWYYHGHFQEGRLWLERVLAMAADGKVPASARADALVGLGVLLHTLDEDDRAVALLAEGAALRRSDSDEEGSAHAESLRGGALVSLGQHDEAEELFQELLTWWRNAGRPELMAHALFHLGLVAFTRDDRERIGAFCQEAVELYDAGGAWLDAIEPLHYLGLNACAAGDLPAAAVYFAEALARLRVRRIRVDFAIGLADVATLGVTRGDLALAARLFGAADAIRRQDGAPLPLPARIAYERSADCARVQLGDEAWSVAHADGSALSLEHALSEAEAGVTAGLASPLIAAPTGHTPPPILLRTTRRFRRSPAVSVTSWSSFAND